jgi:serine/threonine protein kinase
VLKISNKHAAGTLAYQAPELVLEKLTTVSRSAEIYSLGVTMWECLSRTIPHQNKENKIFSLAQNENALMMTFPVKNVIGEFNILPNECDSFSLLEQLSYICTSRNPTSRPNATEVTQYLANTHIISESLPLECLSHWLIDVDDWPIDVDEANDLQTAPQVDTGIGNTARDGKFFPDDDNSTDWTVSKNKRIVQSNITKLNANENTTLPSSKQHATGNPGSDGIAPDGNNMAATKGKQNIFKLCTIVFGLAASIVIIGVIYFVVKKPDPAPSPIAPSSPTLQPVVQMTSTTLSTPTPGKLPCVFFFK